MIRNTPSISSKKIVKFLFYLVWWISYQKLPLNPLPSRVFQISLCRPTLKTISAPHSCVWLLEWVLKLCSNHDSIHSMFYLSSGAYAGGECGAPPKKPIWKKSGEKKEKKNNKIKKIDQNYHHAFTNESKLMSFWG